MRRVPVLLLVPLLVAPLAACGGSSDTPDDPVPKGLTFRVEQSRQDLRTRNYGLQVVNHGSRSVTVTGVRVTSGRFDGASRYRGPATIPPGATVNLVMRMPKARCGSGIDMSATVDYAVTGSPAATSVVRPGDQYGSVALFMKRDCAEASLADVAIDRTFRVEGTGTGSRLLVGVTFTPRAGAGTVHVGPLDGTTLLKPTAAGNVDHDLDDDAAPYRTQLEIIPNRCDVHVVAEDRTGAAMPLHVTSRSAGDAFFYLRFDEAQKAQIFDFVAAHCGFGTVQDPLLAP